MNCWCCYGRPEEIPAGTTTILCDTHREWAMTAISEYLAAHPERTCHEGCGCIPLEALIEKYRKRLEPVGNDG